MEIVEMIDRDFQPGDEEGEGISEVLVALLIEATRDWSSQDYLLELRSLSRSLDAYIDSAERSLA